MRRSFSISINVSFLSSRIGGVSNFTMPEIANVRFRGGLWHRIILETRRMADPFGSAPPRGALHPGGAAAISQTKQFLGLKALSYRREHRCSLRALRPSKERQFRFVVGWRVSCGRIAPVNSQASACCIFVCGALVARAVVRALKYWEFTVW